MDSLFVLTHIKTTLLRLVSVLFCLILGACDRNGNNGQLIELRIITSSGGSAVASDELIEPGDSVTVTLTPDDGYALANISGCNGQLNRNTSPLSYTISNMTSSCSVDVEFLPLYQLTPIINGSGTISPSSIAVMQGQSTSFTLNPDNGNAIASVTGCGGSLTSNIYTTAVLSGPCSITASFIAQHMVSLNTIQNGDLIFSQSNNTNNDSTRLVNEGEQTSLNILPENGYVLETISGCNGSLSGMTYTTGVITSPCAISALFHQQHTVMVNPTNNGTVNPGSANILDGNSTTFTITPNNGYVIQNVNGCGGNLVGNTYTTGAITASCTVNAAFRAFFELNASAGANGSISPTNVEVLDGDSSTFTLTPDAGYTIDDVTGCGGTLTGNTYTTGAITSACSITASFLPLHTVTGLTGIYGSISPASIDIKQGDTTSFNINADNGFIIDTVTGCGGILTGTTYTTDAISSPCTVNASFTVPFTAAALNVAFGSNQSLDFSWPRIAGAGYYRLLENPDGVSGYSQVGTDLSAINLGASPSFNKGIGVNFNNSALFILQTCLGTICLDSDPVSALGDINDTISYIKASNAESGDGFGFSIALSEDGSTLAVGATNEDSNATGVNGDASNNATLLSGAVYVFTKDNGTWTQQAYLKSSSTEFVGNFGYALSLSRDGNTLATSAIYETSDGLSAAGAVHIFTRSGTNWNHQQRLKANEPDDNDQFGTTLALSGSGDRLVVGSPIEASNATGIDGIASDNSADSSGAAYIFERSLGSWSQQHYLKASNAEVGDSFGNHVSISDDGNTIAVGAYLEDSASATDQSDNNSNDSGAVYIFHHAGNWTQQAYLKANIIDADDHFGTTTSLSADGSTLAVNAWSEDSSGQGINPDPNLNDANTSGAVYVFTRTGATWTQQAFIKASNNEALDQFGHNLSLSHSGNLLAVGARGEDSDANGLNGDQSDNSASVSGAAYLFSRENGSWTQTKYIKALNSEFGDFFGASIELSGDGSVLAVGANAEDSNNAFDPSDNSASSAGAAYLH